MCEIDFRITVRRCSRLVTRALLALSVGVFVITNPSIAQPLQPEIATYSKAINGGGAIEVAYQDLAGADKVLSVTVPTSLGDVVVSVDYAGSVLEGYSVALQGTAYLYAVTMSDLGSGSWLTSIDYGSAGSIEMTGNGIDIELESSTISACASIANNSLYKAILEAVTSTHSIALSDNTDRTGIDHMMQAFSLFELVGGAPALIDCDPQIDGASYGGFPCTSQANFDECLTCCEQIHMAILPACGFVAITQPAAGLVCSMAVMLKGWACETGCDRSFHGGAALGETCGLWIFHGAGHCEMLCDGDIIQGDCAAPLVCCYHTPQP